jgi:hypothetical protein
MAQLDETVIPATEEPRGGGVIVVLLIGLIFTAVGLAWAVLT